MKQWLYTELTRAEWSLLRLYLAEMGVKFESSECGELVHVGCFVSPCEEKQINHFIDVMLEAMA